MRRAGPVCMVCRDLGTSVKHNKNQLRDYMEKCQPGQLGSRYRDAGILARRAENLPALRLPGQHFFVTKFHLRAE